MKVERTLWRVATLVAVGLLLAGCCAPQPVEPVEPVEPAEAPPPPPKPTPVVQAPPPASPCEEPGPMARVSRALPTFDKASGVVLVENAAPGRVRVGEEFCYDLKVSNLTASSLEEVTVTTTPPAKFKLKSAEPEADATADGKMTWKLGTLEPKKAQVIRLCGSATGVGEMTGCVDVTYKNPTVCLSVTAVQPELRLAKTAPAEVIACEPIPVRMVVSNPGTGHACNVKLLDKLPDGLTTADGKSEIAIDVGALAPGQSREFTATLRAARTGKFVNKTTASADGGLVAEASAETMVRQPVLVVAKAAPQMRYVGRPVDYDLTVTNKGDAEARNTVLTDDLPEGATFVSASDEGTFAAGKVRWELGTLAPGASKKVSVSLRALRRGRLTNNVTAEAFCARASAEAVTEVRGIPAILLELIDVADPIETGAQETYTITVTNQGSADGTNISVVCTLPGEQEFVSATGPAEATHKDRTVTFEPLPMLGPKKVAVYRVVVKGIKTGDVRFKVRLTSDQMDTPAEETESTHIYE